MREAIDDANDLLLQPFSGLVNSPSNWVMHGVPALLALLVYGLGLGLLANSLPKTAPRRGLARGHLGRPCQALPGR